MALHVFFLLICVHLRTEVDRGILKLGAGSNCLAVRAAILPTLIEATTVGRSTPAQMLWRRSKTASVTSELKVASKAARQRNQKSAIPEHVSELDQVVRDRAWG